MNNVNIIGRVANELELRYTAQGTAVCNMSLAVDGYKEDETYFFEVVTWGKTAENVAEYLGKGRKVAITGELQQNKWQNEQGQNRSKVVINARNVQFLDYKQDNDEQQAQTEQEQEEESLDVPF